MKKTNLILIVILALIFLLGITGFFINQSSLSSKLKPIWFILEKDNASKDTFIYKVEKVSFFHWNTSSGLVLNQYPDFNRGVTSFVPLNDNRIVFLSDASNEIIITKNNGEVIKKIPVTFAPRDIAFDNGLFYVLTENKVFVYDYNGERKQIEFPDVYSGFAVACCNLNNVECNCLLLSLSEY